MTLADAIDIIRPSVVQISLFSPNNPLKYPILGTGFWIHDEGYLLTARHVIEAGIADLRKLNISDGSFILGLAMPNTENMRACFTYLQVDVAADDE